jgi:UTP--glucose-1-phosphate uridylyltransferase
MGAAVEVFDGSRALAVDRSRFRPVKTTNELLLIRSDLYRLTEDALVESTIDHDEPFVDLAKPYAHIGPFESRFPKGVPSIRGCSSLRVEGDTTFGGDVVCTGDVRVGAGVHSIPDGAHLEGDV